MPDRPQDPRSEPDLPPFEAILDRLQTCLPLVGRLKVTARQAEKDAADALDALERAVGLLRTHLGAERERARARRTLSDPKDGAR